MHSNLLAANKQAQISFGGASDAGPKNVNQDAFAALLPSEAHLRDLKGLSLAIADGVSSSSRSQEASQLMVTEFINEYYATAATLSVTASAAQVLRALNSWLSSQNHHRKNYRSDSSLVTTFTAVIVKGESAYIFHCGDSRLYLLRNGSIQQITNDHVRRYDGNWVLTRGMGIEPHIDIDHCVEELQQGDILLLSTDGLHGALGEQEILQLASEFTSQLAANAERDTQSGEHTAMTPQQSTLEALAGNLVQRALDQGSDDNVSCLLAHVDALHGESLEQAHRRLTTRRIPPVLAAGNKIDNYEVTKVLHSSTRSHLYTVRDLNTGEQRVLKAPSPNFADNLQYLDGFMRECWLGQQIAHRAILKTYPTPGDSQFLYEICEYINGQTLRQWITDHPQPALGAVRDILQQLVEGMRILQRKGILHRDIKPENIMLSEHGRVVIIDFGTVKIDGLDEIVPAIDEDIPVGSVDYIAPEYLLHGEATMQADLYAVGCVAYEMLTGKLPYNMESSRLKKPRDYAAWKYRPLRQLRKDLPIWVELTLQKATAPQPTQRYGAYSEFIQDMMQPNKAALKLAKSRPLMERHPVRFWQCTSALLLLALVVQFYWQLR